MASSSKSPEQLTQVVRDGCLKRGANGIKGFTRAFKLLDVHGNRSVNKDEFVRRLKQYQIGLSEEEMGELFDNFHSDGSGSMDFDEFLEHLRPMNDRRKELIKEAFKKIDKSGDGNITVEDLKGVYQASQHPKYKNKEWDEKKCLEEFLKNFEDDNPDGKVTQEEFLNYYAGVSASIDEDDYFIAMINQAWDLSD